MLTACLMPPRSPPTDGRAVQPNQFCFCLVVGVCVRVCVVCVWFYVCVAVVLWCVVGLCCVCLVLLFVYIGGARITQQWVVCCT